MNKEWVDFWPDNELELLGHCPVCRSKQRELLHAGLRDRAFRVAPGAWTLYRCLGCQSGYLDPRPTVDSIGRAYTNYYTHQTNDHPIVRRIGVLRTFLHDALNGYRNAVYGLNRQPSLPLGRWLIPLLPPLKAAVDAECRHLPRPVSNGLVLDVGCGNGGFLCLAKEIGWQVYGIDMDPKAVEMARSRGLNVECGGIELLSHESQKYDVITLSHVIEHVHDPLDLLHQLYRLLKPGGVLWIETPNLRSLGYKYFKSSWRGLESPRHLVLFDSISLIDILSKVGFISIKQRWRGLVAIAIFAVSDAIKGGGQTLENVSRGGKPKLIECLAEVIEMLFPSQREFITFKAIKGK
jgi:2-polyprenyl-3-methyl-5-hydroxy-6-metoxy-1,4-benzoquinol methylase